MIYQALLRTASRTPEHAALITKDREVPFRVLTEMAGRAAAAFAEAGLRRGDRVLVLLGNGPEYAAVFFGSCRSGESRFP